MDIDRNKINEMKSECLQMPDYIRDMIEETVEQQLKKKQRYGKKMWRVAAAILAFACVGGGTTLAAAKLYNMQLHLLVWLHSLWRRRACRHGCSIRVCDAPHIPCLCRLLRVSVPT
jgi:hypothetical protein